MVWLHIKRGVLAYFGFGILGIFAHLKLGFSLFEIQILESHHSKMGFGYSLGCFVDLKLGFY